MPVGRFDCWDYFATTPDPEGEYVLYEEYKDVADLLLECHNRLKTEYDPADAELLERIEKTLEIEDK